MIGKLRFSLRSFVLLGALGVACGAQKGVLSFDAQPPLVCPNAPVELTWEVDGPASLQATPQPAKWKDGEVSSSGSRTVNVTEHTVFTLTAPEADPAGGHATGSRPVDVKAPRNERGSSAACDAQICSGSFELKSGGRLSALKLTDPTFTRGGEATPREVCVISPGGTKTCVPAGGEAPLTGAADGQWTIQTTLAPGEASKPPPTLSVTFDFGCP